MCGVYVVHAYEFECSRAHTYGDQSTMSDVYSLLPRCLAEAHFSWLGKLVNKSEVCPSPPFPSAGVTGMPSCLGLLSVAVTKTVITSNLKREELSPSHFHITALRESGKNQPMQRLTGHSLRLAHLAQDHLPRAASPQWLCPPRQSSLKIITGESRANLTLEVPQLRFPLLRSHWPFLKARVLRILSQASSWQRKDPHLLSHLPSPSALVFG